MASDESQPLFGRTIKRGTFGGTAIQDDYADVEAHRYELVYVEAPTGPGNLLASMDLKGEVVASHIERHGSPLLPNDYRVVLVILLKVR